MGSVALVGLGSNLGDRGGQLDTALDELARSSGVEVCAVSSYHETVSVGGPAGQGAYLNAAVLVETTREPLDLLRLLQDLERKAGRIRTVRWGERPIDLDVLLFGDRVIEIGAAFGPGVGGDPLSLIVPHPRMAFRRFVLAPAAEVAPDVVDPLSGRTVAALLANLDRRPSYVAIHDPSRQFGEGLCRCLVDELSAVEVRDETKPGRGMPSGPGLPEARVDSRREAMAADLWTPERSGDGWLVSDFWFDAGFAALDAEVAAHPGLRERFLEARRQVLAPTFAVAARGARRLFSRGSPAWRGAPGLGDVPILEVDPGDPGAVAAEVLAACAASR